MPGNDIISYSPGAVSGSPATDDLSLSAKNKRLLVYNNIFGYNASKNVFHQVVNRYNPELHYSINNIIKIKAITITNMICSRR